MYPFILGDPVLWPLYVFYIYVCEGHFFAFGFYICNVFIKFMNNIWLDINQDKKYAKLLFVTMNLLFSLQLVCLYNEILSFFFCSLRKQLLCL